MVRIVDVNDATVKMLGAQTKDELARWTRSSCRRPSRRSRARWLAIAEGRTSFESETVLRTLQGDKLAVLFTITFPPESARLGRACW